LVVVELEQIHVLQEQMVLIQVLTEQVLLVAVVEQRHKRQVIQEDLVEAVVVHLHLQVVLLLVEVVQLVKVMMVEQEQKIVLQ
tara:strand:- start:208 stop:456 length:249 start_codon:yes stop_codon:yes gene_type:complete